MIDTILVATDGSEQACKAVDLAGDLALKYGAGVNLVHVVPPPDLEQLVETPAEPQAWTLFRPNREASGPGPGATGTRGGPARQSMGARLLSSAEQALREQGLRDITTTLLDGDPAGAILERSREIGADMIILGSRRISELEVKEARSVSHRVAHMARCTCVTIT